jgi:hypothetical protein
MVLPIVRIVSLTAGTNLLAAEIVLLAPATVLPAAETVPLVARTVLWQNSSVSNTSLSLIYKKMPVFLSGKYFWVHPNIFS